VSGEDSLPSNITELKKRKWVAGSGRRYMEIV
jgi:hypothetical protein